jgi:hypothetical protein
LEDSVQDARDTREICWLEDLSIFEQEKWVSREIANTTADSDR